MTLPPHQTPKLWTPPLSAPQGKYHIVKPLKIGGTAAIYLAIMRGENNFSREVVIKRPLPHLVAEPRSRHMFIDEAHIASRLSHPNICQVLDLVAREDELYIVLEYLRGVDLREILKRCIQLGRLLPPEVAVWVAIEMAAGLDYAHDATAVDGRPLNLIHRDVSPKNIRVTFEGSVKVIDFGIARAEHRITQTSAGTIKGTLGYMSPEQILGDDIDRRSDIFAFGIVLFQMLTLRNPFDGPTLKERVRKLTQAPIPSVREFNPALDDDIANIVTRCLERGVEERYQRLADVQAALDQYLARLQVVSPRQRLIGFLRDIFPKFDEFDDDLKVALSEISQFSGPVDASVRLRFPDDPPTEPMPASGLRADGTVGPNPSLPTRPSTAATEPADPTAPRNGQTGDDALATEGRGPTRPIPFDHPADSAATVSPDGGRPPRSPAATTDPRGWSDAGVEDTRRLADLDKPARRSPSEGWGLMLILAAAAMLGAGAVTVFFWPQQELSVVTSMPQENSPPTVAETNAQKVAAVPDAKRPAQRSAQRPPERPARRSAPNKRSRTKTRKARTAESPRPDRDRARLLFQTAVRLKKRGNVDDAVFLYELAYAHSGRRVDPSIYLNLGLIHNEGGRDAQAKACLQGYLQRRPAAPQAARVRTLVSSFPPLPAVQCVDGAAARRALKIETRRGAQIQQWLDETLKGRLQNR